MSAANQAGVSLMKQIEHGLCWERSQAHGAATMKRLHYAGRILGLPMYEAAELPVDTVLLIMVAEEMLREEEAYWLDWIAGLPGARTAVG